MILADSSVWIDHLRDNDERLATLLAKGQVLMHPKVVGELACGSLSNRGNRLRQWRDLPPLKSVSDDEAVQFLERHLLMSRGIGFIDVHLLAAVAQARGARLCSHDKRLAGIATELGFAFQPHDA